MAVMPRQEAPPGWNFWMRWMLASIAGAVAYAVVLAPFLEILAHFAPGEAAPLPPWLGWLIGVISVCAIGALIGFAQWLVLRRTLRRIGWWVPATLAGYAALLAIGPALSRLEPGWPVGWIVVPATGTVLGILQWLVLRGRVGHAGWWIVISTGGWLLAHGLTGLAVVSGLYVEPFDLLAAFLVPVAVAGAGLVWLLQRSPARPP